MTVKAILSEYKRKSDGMHQIKLKIQNRHMVFKMSTAFYVKATEWNHMAGTFKKANRQADKVRLNQKINRIEELYCTGEFVEKSPAEFKRAVQQLFSPKTVDPLQYKSLTALIDMMLTERSHHYSANTISNYKSLQSNLRKYQDFNGGGELNVQALDKQFYHRFFHLFLSQHCKRRNASINQTMIQLKAFLNWLVKTFEQITLPYGIEHLKPFKTLPASQYIVVYTQEEVEALIHTDLSSKPRLDRTRDALLFQIITGQRFGDISQFHKDQLTTGSGEYPRWVLTTQKVDKRISIPLVGLGDLALSILKKYDYKLPSLSNQNANKYIKELGKYLGFTRSITKEYFVGYELIKETKPLWEVMSTHTARKTNISLLANSQKDQEVAMLVSGHSDSSQLKAYLKYDQMRLEKAYKDMGKTLGIEKKDQ